MNLSAIRETLAASPFDDRPVIAADHAWASFGEFFAAVEQGLVDGALLGADLLVVMTEPLMDAIELVSCQVTGVGALLMGQRADQQILGMVDTDDGAWVPLPR